MIRIETIETATALRAAFVRIWRRSRWGLGPQDFDADHARGMCVVTSQALHVLDGSWTPVFGTVDVPRSVAVGGFEPHTWCERDGVVLDLTGDQFPGYPPVHLGPRPDGYSGTCACGDPACAEIMLEDEYRTAHDWAQQVQRELHRFEIVTEGGDVVARHYG